MNLATRGYLISLRFRSTDPLLGRSASPLQRLTASSRVRKSRRGQAVLGRQNILPTPWLTERHGYDPTSFTSPLAELEPGDSRVPDQPSLSLHGPVVGQIRFTAPAADCELPRSKPESRDGLSLAHSDCVFSTATVRSTLPTYRFDSPLRPLWPVRLKATLLGSPRTPGRINASRPLPKSVLSGPDCPGNRCST